MRKHVFPVLLLTLTLAGVAAQEVGPRPPKPLPPPAANSPGGEALSRLKSAHHKALVEVTGGRAMIIAPRDPEKAKKWTARMQAVQAAYINNLKNLRNKFSADPATHQIQWELCRLLHDTGQEELLRRELITLRAPGLTLEMRLLAAKWLADRHLQQKALQLLDRVDPSLLRGQRQRVLLAAILTAGCRDDQAAKIITKELAPLTTPDEIKRAAHGLIMISTPYPHALGRPFLILVYRELIRRLPEDKGVQGRAAMIAGLNLRQGDQAPQFTGADRQDRKLGLADFKGKVVLIHFWQAQLGDCVSETKWIGQLWEEARKKGFSPIGICLNKDRDLARKEAAKQNIYWPLLNDGLGYSSPFLTIFGVVDIPFTILIDQAGAIAGIGLSAKDTEKRIRKLLGLPGRSPAKKTVPEKKDH